MPDQLYWTPELSLGVPELDNQHKELIEQINKLVEASEAGKGMEGIVSVIDFLTGYANAHLIEEEDLMVKNAFPGLEAHQAEHRQFQETLEKFKEKISQQGFDPETQKAFNAMIVDWLFQHICQKDREFGKFLGTAR